MPVVTECGLYIVPAINFYQGIYIKIASGIFFKQQKNLVPVFFHLFSAKHTLHHGMSW